MDRRFVTLFVTFAGSERYCTCTILYVDSYCTDHVYGAEADGKASWDSNEWDVDEGSVCGRMSTEQRRYLSDLLGNAHSSRSNHTTKCQW